LQLTKEAADPYVSLPVTFKSSIFSTPEFPKDTYPLKVPVATFRFLQLQKVADSFFGSVNHFL